jgi:tetratricopeptide (TPR) repeat protein
MTQAMKSTLVHFLLIGVLCLAVYSFMLSGSFSVMDDQVSIVDNPVIRDFANLPEIFTSSFFGGSSYYRPLVSLSFMIEYHLAGPNPLFFKLNNLIIHILTLFCLYGIVHLLFRKRILSFAVGCAYALHPIHWEQVSQVAGRAILLCALFYMLAFFCFILAGRRKNKAWYGASLLCFIMSFLSKESAVTLPFVILSYQFFLGRAQPRKRIQTEDRFAWIYPAVPFFLIGLAFLFWRQWIGITNIPRWDSLRHFALGHLTFIRGFLTYLRLLIFPVGLHFDRSIRYFHTFQNIELIATGCLYLLTLVSLGVYRRRIPRKVFFFISWVVLTLLPVAQLIPLSARNGYASLAEHFLYIPSVGLFVLGALGVQRLVVVLKRRKLLSTSIAVTSGIGLLLFWSLITIQQNICAQEELALLQQSLRHNPQNVRIRNSYALALALEGLYAQAENQYRMVLAINPGNVNARIGLGKSLCDQDKIWQGIKEYEKLAHLPTGRYADLLSDNLKLAYEALITRYEKKIQEQPRNASHHFRLGVLYSKTQRVQDGIRHYQKALAIEPAHKKALHNLIWSHEQLGQYKKAAEYCERLLSLPFANAADKEQMYKRLIAIQKKIIKSQATE